MALLILFLEVDSIVVPILFFVEVRNVTTQKLGHIPITVRDVVFLRHQVVRFSSFSRLSNLVAGGFSELRLGQLYIHEQVYEDYTGYKVGQNVPNQKPIYIEIIGPC